MIRYDLLLEAVGLCSQVARACIRLLMILSLRDRVDAVTVSAEDEAEMDMIPKHHLERDGILLVLVAVLASLDLAVGLEAIIHLEETLSKKKMHYCANATT